MRYMSVAVAIVIALLDASCMLCSGDEISPTNANSRAAFQELNTYLARHENSINLAKNIEAAKKYLSEPDANPQVKPLVELFQQIDPEDLCGGENMPRKRNFIMGLASTEPNLFQNRTSMTRLGTLVHRTIEEASDVCFDYYEREWLKDLAESEHFILNIENLKPLFEDSDVGFRVDGPGANSSPRHWRREIAEFELQVKRLREQYEVELPTAEKLAAETCKDFKGEFRAALDTLKQKKADGHFTSNSELVYESLVAGPCRKFLEHEKSRAILRPLWNLADMVDFTKLRLKPIQGDTISSFVWARRYQYCDYILSLDKSVYIKKAIDIVNSVE